MNNRLLSLEEIAFQIGKGFGFALETLFTEMIGKTLTDDEAQTQYADKISDIIYDYSGLNMDVDLVVAFIEGEQGPAMMRDTVRNGHILSTHMEMYNGLESKDAEEILTLVDGGNIGTFNHKTGRVTGLLSEKAKNILYLRWSDCCTTGFTPGELAAVTLHEVGHAVTMLEYAGHITTANMILAALLKTTRDDSVETRKIVFKKAADVIGGNTNFDGMETITDNCVVTTVVMDAYFEERVSINGSSLYDVVTSEQLADQYCNRMGYGRHLVLAFERIDDVWFGKGGGHDRSRQRRMISYVADILKIVAGGVGIVMTIVSPTPLNFKIQAVSILTVMTGLILVGNVISLNTPAIYDTTRVRLLRVREDTVVFLKDLGLPNDILKEKIKELEQIDKVISTYLSKDYRPIISVFMSWFSQKRKDNDAIHNLQRKLEELSANNLFVQSARLRTMGNESIVDFVKGVFKGKKPKDTLAQKLDYVTGHQNFKDRKIEITKSVFGNVSNEQELLQFVKEYSDFVNCLPEIHKKISQTTIELAEYYVKCAKEMDSTNKPIDLNRIKLAKKQILTKVFGSPSSNKYLPKQIGSDYSYTTTSDGVRLNIGLTQASAWYGELKGPTKLSVSAGILYRIQEYLETIIQKGIECEQLAEEDSYDYKGEERYYISTKFDEVVCDRLYANWNGEDFRNECIEFYKDLNESLRTDILKVNDVILNDIIEIID